MRKFTFLLTLLLAFVTTAMAQVDTNKEYRVKHTGTGYFMNASSYDAHPTGPTGGVNFVAEAESDDQVFTVEAEGTGYKLKTKSGKYIFCQPWNVDALDQASLLTFSDNGDGTFKIMNGTKYFKVEAVSGTYYPFCDAGLTASADFELVEVATAPVEPEVPATPLEVVSVSPSEAAAALSELTITFNQDVAGQFDQYAMVAMKLKKGTGVASGVSNYVVDGAVLTVTLSQEVTEAGEYTLVIPEGLITRKSDGAAYSGEHVFTVAEATPEVPNAELAETYNGIASMSFFGSQYNMQVSIVFGKDKDGAAKEGYATLKVWDYESFNMEVSDCVPYEVNGNTVVLKGVTVGAGDGTINTKQVDFTFTVNEDGTLSCSEKVYGPTPDTSIIEFDFGADVFTPEAAPVVPEVDEATLAAIEKAEGLLAKVGVGYPAAESAARTALAAAVEEAKAAATTENGAKVNAAISAYYSETNVTLPESGKAYTFTMVAKNGNKFYLNYTGADVAMTAVTGEALPESAKFVATANGDGTYTFQTNDGNYLVYHSKYAGVSWLQGASTTGFQAEKDDMTNITLAKLSAGNNVSATDEQVFGLVSWYSVRGVRNDNGANEMGYMVLKADGTDFDGATAPFWNDNFSSAFLVEETEVATPEVPETPALELVSVSPEDNANLSAFDKVVLTFNKPVTVVESDEAGAILMFNGMPAMQLWTDLSEDGKSVTMHAGAPIDMVGTYGVYVMPGTFVDADGNLSEEMMFNYTVAGAADGFTYTYASPTTERTLSSLGYIMLGFASDVASVKTDVLNVVDSKGNVVTTATLEADWFDPQAVSVMFANELSYTGTCSLTVPAEFITSTLGTHNPEFTLTYNLEAEPRTVYFYHPEYNGVLTMAADGASSSLVKNFTEEELLANEWQLHPVEGKNRFLVSNKATGLYLGSCNTSVNVAGVDAANAKVYELQKDGVFDVLKDVEGGAYNYLHVAGHNVVVGWEAGSAASHWFVLNSVDDYYNVLANLELADSLNQLISKGEELIEKAQPYYKPLITSATQFTSNAKESTEGSYEALLDGDDRTFFHTAWSVSTGAEAHNLQVLVPGNELTELWVKYQARNAGGAYNDRPTKMSIYGGTVAEDGTVTYETTAFANLTTADGIGETAGEFRFTADKAYDAFKFEVHETVMSDNTVGNKWFTYGEFQMYSQALTPAELEMTESQAANLSGAIEYAKGANLVTDSYEKLIEDINRAINKVLYPAATVESVDPACGHYTEMPGTIKMTFSGDVKALEYGMVRTDFTGFRGYYLTEEDYTINGKELTFTVPAEYVTNSANMMVTLGVIDANDQYVTYASDPDYLSEDCVFLMYTADMKSDLFVMESVDPAEGTVETLEVINMTFGSGNTFVGGFDKTKEVVVLDAEGNVVTKAAMEVVMESEVDPDTDETYSWPTATAKFTLETPVTEAGEYTLVVPEATVYNEGFYEDVADLGVSWGAIYNPEIRVAYTVEGLPVDVYAPRHTGTKERNDRNITAVKVTGWLGEQVYSLTATEQSQDFTDATAVATFKAVAGEELTPVVEHAGEWVHHAVYVDYDADGFTSGIEEGSEWKPAGDLVSYCFYNNGGSSDEYGYNSVGTSIAGMDRHMPKLPVFTAPTVPGTYRVRFVQDWCSIDPAGDADGKFGDFKANGGQIVDVLLEVGEYTGINGVSVEDLNDVYTLDGRKVAVKAGQKLNKGLYIVGGKKVFVK